ncbi:hypothetical protein [Flavobacterium poyangense]|uniref:hypothetical protein n=1 Tax=Flavobacterium poyangense TaxID=2204302 RepID=UPI0014206DB5|nr:hypothetical protein [Flavobacterium sp. JXAS1]
MNLFGKQIEKIRSNPKTIFLIDGSGALLTATLLLFVLRPFDFYFGMPTEILTVLSVTAFFFAFYSFFCFIQPKPNLQKLLKPIILANSIYCITTLGLVFFFINRLTALGILYFIGELLIICGLIYVELKILKTTKQA